MSNLIEVPWDQLAPETLRALVEEFVTRDGTDYGEHEVSVESKAEQVLAGIRQKQYLIIYDQDLDSVQLVTVQEWRAAGY